MPRTRPRTAFLSLVAAGCAFALALLMIPSHGDVHAALKRPVRPSVIRQAPPVPDVPVRLKIPGIGVDAAVESVGITPKGAMDVPKNVDNVGWYNLGVRPGDKGSAVFAGHLDWYDGKTAVFQHLDKLGVGDVLSIETDQGKILPFVVREIRAFKQHETAIEVFKKSEGRHLNLITCGGIWDTFRKMYSERLVIFTDAVDVSVETK